MRFGTSAIVRVGRGPAPMPVRDGRGPSRGFAPAPPQVRVGRQRPPAQTRTGQQAAGTAQTDAYIEPAFDPNSDFPPGAGWGPNLWCGARDRVRQEPLGSTRATVPSLATQEFLFQPCTPFKLHYFTIPESFALLFTVLSIRICREELIEGEVPGESFSDQGGFVNNIVNGRYAYPSVPARVLVRNDSGADVPFNAMFYGAVENC